MISEECYNMINLLGKGGVTVEIDYRTKKLRKICTDAEEAEKEYGLEMAEKIQQRIDELKAAISVEMMIQHRIGRCHQLKGDRKGEFALDLVQPYRLVFKQTGTSIQIAKVIEIVDYH